MKRQLSSLGWAAFWIGLSLGVVGLLFVGAHAGQWAFFAFR